MQYFWLLLLLVFFWPTLQKKVLSWRRHRRIRQIEKDRDSRVILLVQRQESMQFLGFPIMRYIDINDSEEVLRAIHETDPDVPLDLVLHTPGGLVLASLQIARALREHPGKTTVFVPHHAMSGGTLIALAADEIVMAPHAVLGPVDPQLQQSPAGASSPAASVLHAVKSKPVSEVEDQTLMQADVARKSLFQLRESVKELLPGDMSSDKKSSIAELLSMGTWTHDYPLKYEILDDMGLPVVTEVPDKIYDLLSLYPQPTRRQGGVEFVPSHRGRDKDRPRSHHLQTHNTLAE